MASFELDRDGKQIESVSNLLNLMKDERKRPDNQYGAVWLRGTSWSRRELIPTAGRTHRFAGLEADFDGQVETDLLHRFRRFAYEHLGRPIGQWEALFLARHHGLPVRILDWTSSPFAALYFACEFTVGSDPGDACIWMLVPGGNITNRIDPFEENDDPFAVKGISILYPMVISPRINAQCGYFTIQENPRIPLEQMHETDFDAEHLDITRLVEIRIPSGQRQILLRELNEREVTRKTLFPDLDGIAKGLINAEILRRERWL